MTHQSDSHTSKPEIDERATRRRRIQSAVDHANSYQAEEEKNEGSEVDHIRPMEEWSDIVGQRIEDAVRQGLFDNLSGRGKPLDLRRDPFLPEDQQMAVTLLHNYGIAPEWISERSTLLSSIDEVRAELHLAVAQTNSAMRSAQDEEQRREMCNVWTAWRKGWQERMEKLNDRILVHNLKQPVPHLEIVQLRLSDELALAGADPGWN